MKSTEFEIQGMIRQEWRKIGMAERLLRGTLNRVELDGGRVVYLLTWKGEMNRTKTVYVKKNQVKEVKEMLENYKKTRQTIEKVVNLTARLFRRS